MFKPVSLTLPAQQLRLHSSFPPFPFFPLFRPFSWEDHRGPFCRDGLSCSLPGASSSGPHARHATSGIFPSRPHHRIIPISPPLKGVSDKAHPCRKGSSGRYPSAERLCATNPMPFGDRVEQKRELSVDCTCRSF